METTTVKDISEEAKPKWWREPSWRARRAVEIFVEGNGRISKAEALRQVEYSPAVVDVPGKVFNQRPVLKMLADNGITDQFGIDILKRNGKARRAEMMYFPVFKEKKEAEEGEGTDFDNSEKIRGQQMTDADIRDFLVQNNCDVYRIEHGEQARRVYFYTIDSKAQLQAADTLFKLLGSYAPTKVEGKHDHRVGVFSMADLRRKVKVRGIKITDTADIIINKAQQDYEQQ